MSVSIIEHIRDKEQAIKEAARVLRPGGLLIMSFDICEPNMGMTFPKWNGQALTMFEFDTLFTNSPWFEAGLSELPWNTDDIPKYLSWNRTTAPHHNYVTGAVVVRRSDRIWKELIWKDCLRILREKIHTAFSVAIWYLRHNFRNVPDRFVRLIKSILRRILSSFRPLFKLRP
jgi:SAM-dependent methyltransferase